MRIASDHSHTGDKSSGPAPTSPLPTPRSRVTIEQAAILARHNQDNFVCASTADFTCGPHRSATADQYPKALPYCLDIPARKIVYLGGLDARTARTAPFYYLYARRSAAQAQFRPWHHQPMAVAPLFLFSAGRCGSTLLCQMLNAAGMAAVSEPDFYTQFTASMLFDTDPKGLYAAIGPTLQHMTADLATTLADGGKLVIKLRSDVSMAVRPLMALFPEARKSLFLYRDFPGWARSTLRSFPCKPTQLISQYLQGLSCLSFLKERSQCHLIRYEALIRDPAAVMNQLSDFFETPLDSGRAIAAMAGDAQAGTPLARGLQYDPPDFEARLSRALALWQNPIHQSMIAGLLPPNDP